MSVLHHLTIPDRKKFHHNFELRISNDLLVCLFRLWRQSHVTNSFDDISHVLIMFHTLCKSKNS